MHCRKNSQFLSLGVIMSKPGWHDGEDWFNLILIELQNTASFMDQVVFPL